MLRSLGCSAARCGGGQRLHGGELPSPRRRYLGARTAASCGISLLVLALSFFLHGSLLSVWLGMKVRPGGRRAGGGQELWLRSAPPPPGMAGRSSPPPMPCRSIRRCHSVPSAVATPHPMRRLPCAACQCAGHQRHSPGAGPGQVPAAACGGRRGGAGSRASRAARQGAPKMMCLHAAFLYCTTVQVFCAHAAPCCAFPPSAHLPLYIALLPLAMPRQCHALPAPALQQLHAVRIWGLLHVPMPASIKTSSCPHASSFTPRGAWRHACSRSSSWHVQPPAWQQRRARGITGPVSCRWTRCRRRWPSAGPRHTSPQCL